MSFHHHETDIVLNSSLEKLLTKPPKVSPMSSSAFPAKPNTVGLMDRILRDSPTSTQHQQSNASSKGRKSRAKSNLQARVKGHVLGNQGNPALTAAMKKLEPSGRTIYNAAKSIQGEESSRRRTFRQTVLAREGFTSLSEDSMVNAAEGIMMGDEEGPIGPAGESARMVAGVGFGEPTLNELTREGSWTALANAMFEELIDVGQCL